MKGICDKSRLCNKQLLFIHLRFWSALKQNLIKFYSAKFAEETFQIIIMSKLIKLIPVLLLIFLANSFHSIAQPSKKHNLIFDAIPDRWDRGIPLGNGMIGGLIWQKEGKLRISVDRADLWDLRPTAEIDKFTYKWAYEHRLSGDWDTVWKVADEPYDRDPGPTKLPGVAVEFNIKDLGKVKSVELNISSAICMIVWENNVRFRIFVDALNPVIRYSWEGTSIKPELIPPAYSIVNAKTVNSPVVEGYSLARLGYKQGKVRKSGKLIVYTQKAWGPLKYKAAIASNNNGGAVSISSHYSDQPRTVSALETVKKAIKTTFDDAASGHKQWWRNYWAQSSVSIPDKQLEKQYFLEMYKFGAASRKGAPPISLQAVWTADNGLLPPWKGDFHNDLNTQLSYWPAYSSNHLEEASVFTDWLWKNKPYFEKYTKRVFGTDGLNVPGVATLRGHEMGGWHMYSMSSTVSCWLAQNFYWQWRYSMDRDFLASQAYPWISGVAKHIEQLTDSGNSTRKLPMSSSPEFHDGGINAWFLHMTNYDIALCKYIFNIASELADELSLEEESNHWKSVGNQFLKFDIDPNEGLTIAPGYPYHESHRHFSHLMAIHPLGLLNFDNPEDQIIIENSVRNLEKQGTNWWCGYSYSWLGNIYAWMKEGEKATPTLRKFASCFCSTNSFHLNGDQCKAGYSKFTYDPFTLEGNFAFASAIQEMLLQSHAGYIDIFPALPPDWKVVSFNNLRAEGAFLISATKENGVNTRFRIESEKGGTTFFSLPFPTYVVKSSEGAKITPEKNKFFKVEFDKNGFIEIENGYE
jgi:alpha-L-fucosidase 2